jgi:16S rRNA (guanine527-N7)-methyltransferase
VSAALAATLASLGADVRAAARMETYVALLLERNAELNLTGAKTIEGAFEHVRDSLSLAPYVREPLVDIGSGGGFPAIPLAIALGMRMALVESVVKKARFLREVIAVLDLPVTVHATRAEVAARDPELRERFASATARAVASASTVIELTVPFLQVGGVAILQRGALTPAERAAATDAALVLGAQVTGEISFEGDERRRVLVVQKVGATGQRFPRRVGIPAKRPLCWEGRDG